MSIENKLNEILGKIDNVVNDASTSFINAIEDFTDQINKHFELENNLENKFFDFLSDLNKEMNLENNIKKEKQSEKNDKCNRKENTKGQTDSFKQKESDYGYHTVFIPKAKPYTFEKIEEEFEELKDAYVNQKDKVMTICELTDLILAIKQFSEKEFNMTLDDLLKFSSKTENAFKNGKR